MAYDFKYPRELREYSKTLLVKFPINLLGNKIADELKTTVWSNNGSSQPSMPLKLEISPFYKPGYLTPARENYMIARSGNINNDLLVTTPGQLNDSFTRYMIAPLL